jgi:hypothetical protein
VPQSTISLEIVRLGLRFLFLALGAEEAPCPWGMMEAANGMSLWLKCDCKGEPSFSMAKSSGPRDCRTLVLAVSNRSLNCRPL